MVCNMTALLLNAAAATIALIIGAFLVGVFQSFRSNVKLNLQGLDKEGAIQKAANALVKAWYKLDKDDPLQKASMIAADALAGIGYNKEQIAFVVRSIQIDYNAYLRTSSKEEVALVSLVHLILYHYSRFKPIRLRFIIESNKMDIELVLAAVRDAQQSQKL